MKDPLHILILAAGKGKRMHSELAKVLHPVLFRPMLHYVIDLAKSLPQSSVSIIVGHQEEEVRAACCDYVDLNYFSQKEQLGTANAVRSAESYLRRQTGRVLILSGDVILLSSQSLSKLLAKQEQSDCSGALLVSTLEDPFGYGRIVRDSSGVMEIREEVDCDTDLRKIREVNTGIYCFKIPDLLGALERVQNQNRQKEYYLPDVVKILSSEKKRVEIEPLADPIEALGINDRKTLAEVELRLQRSVNERWMLKGATLRDPASVWIDTGSEIGADVVIEPGCQIISSVIGRGCRVEAFSRLVHSRIGEKSQIKQGSYVESSEIGRFCSVGPYAHLRPGSRLSDSVKVGNFVEIKNTTLGSGSKASHLSYLGDAKVGKGVNVGCGFITCNYDGEKKHETVIEDDVFIGSDSQTIAPVTLGKGCYIASGSTITHDVPSEGLAFARTRQVNKAGYARRYRKRMEKEKKSD